MSRWGASRRLVCPVCDLAYDRMRTGLTFGEVRRLIISIGWCSKRDRVKNGRRNGVLGYWHQLKLMQWDQHVGLCEAGTRELSEAA